MKRFYRVCMILCIAGALCFACAAAELDTLAEAIADYMGKESFVVRVAFGELLQNRVDSDAFPNTLAEVALDFTDGHIGDAGESDYRAAEAAKCRFGFAGDALYVEKWKNVQHTPLELRSGVCLYDWFFYT